MLSTQLQLSPSAPRAGASTELSVRVQDAHGKPVSKLPLSHGEPMHLFVISNDLEAFAHLHPKPRDGAFAVRHTFDAGGDYTVFLDYARPDGQAPVDRHPVRVEGVTRPREALAETAKTQRSGGLEMALHGGDALRAGTGAKLHIAIKDATTGRAVDDLEPYLGAMAHFVVLSEDGKDFLHVHPLDTAPGHGVAAHTAFPRAGLYKMWVQVQRRGTVVTVPFVVRVASGDDTAHAAPPGGMHHAHH